MTIGIAKGILPIFIQVVQRNPLFFQLQLKDYALILYGSFDQFFKGKRHNASVPTDYG